ERSRGEHLRRQRALAGGVSTAFRAQQRPVPITFVAGRGARLTDIDGNEYIDYALAFGPMLLGHSPRAVVEAVRHQVGEGIGYGACHPLESRLSEALCRIVPCAERAIFSNSGSEAVHAAIRIARAATGRRRVIKFLGHWHGWLDTIAVGTAGKTDSAPTTGGQDPLAAEAVTVIPWNDPAALEVVLSDDVAAVIMEPVAINGGAFVPAPGYLAKTLELTRRAGAILIFDEVITGFRLALGGAQEWSGVVPDLAVFGKALGNGFPISAVCGRADIMEVVSSRTVAHVGTTNANPVCAAAALAALGELESRSDEIYPRLAASGERLATILRDAALESGLPLWVNQIGGAAHAFWSEAPVETYAASIRADMSAYLTFSEALLDEGVHVITRGLLYVSAVHSDADLEETAERVRRAAARVGATTPATTSARS
ncbi:MAG: aminotransferase class III-fold pyridoxal phosphate-dependent enzyme, partial [Actinobacteria bacterium]|nr:aminotransferase class III-fold pyridoxal phosphate-dependent enzyme [Actinomycetota bacterium]